MEIKDETLDELIAASKGELLGPDGLLKQLSKRLLERLLEGELTEHLGYDKHDPAGHGLGNSRNGKSAKTLKGAQGELTIAVPRDRNGTFDPQIVKSVLSAMRLGVDAVQRELIWRYDSECLRCPDEQALPGFAAGQPGAVVPSSGAPARRSVDRFWGRLTKRNIKHAKATRMDGVAGISLSQPCGPAAKHNPRLG